MPAVDLGEHRPRIRFALRQQGVIPCEFLQGPVPLVLRVGQPGPQSLTQLEEELQLALAVPRRTDGLVTPLQQPLGLGEGPGFFHVVGRGEEEHLGVDVLGPQLARGDLRTVLPPRGGFNEVEVPHHQPLQVGHTQPLQPPVGRANRRVLAQHEVTLDLVLEHCHHGLVGAVGAVEPGHVVVGPAVVLPGGIPPPGLEQTHGVRVGLRPEALLLLDRDGVHVLVKGLLVHRGHGQVARQQVEQGGDVRGALDTRVTAQGHDPAARPSHVAQQQLQHRRGADELRAQGVVGPAHRVGEARGALPPRVLRDGTGKVIEVLRRDPAGVPHHLRGVARVVALEDLQHRVGVLQRLVPVGMIGVQRRAAAAVLVAAGALALLVTVLVAAGVLPVLILVPRSGPVVPGGMLIGTAVRVVTGEQPVQILGILVVAVDDRGRIGVGQHVLVKPQVVGEHIVDQPAQQGDVRPHPDGQVFVGHGRGAREPWIHVDDLGPARLGFRDPLESHRVALGHVGTLDDDTVRVGHVLEGLGGAAAPERGSQTGNRGGVSNPGLVLDLHGPCCGEQLLDQVVLFVVQGGPAQCCDAHGAAQDPALLIRVLPRAPAGLQEAVHHHVHCSVEIQLLPFRGPRRPVQHTGLAARGVHELLARRTFGAQAPTGNG